MTMNKRNIDPTVRWTIEYGYATSRLLDLHTRVYGPESTQDCVKILDEALAKNKRRSNQIATWFARKLPFALFGVVGKSKCGSTQ